MKEKTLLQISILCSILGLMLLFYLSETVELSQTDINKITPEDIGKNVKVCGKIDSRTISKNQHVLIKLQDNSGVIDLVVFNNTAESLDAYKINKGVYLCFVGTVDKYQGKLGIVVKKMGD